VTQLLVRGGQLVKQERPIRWITVGGKRVPITAPKAALYSTEFDGCQFNIAAKPLSEIQDTLVSLGYEVTPGRLYAVYDEGFFMPDGSFVTRGSADVGEWASIHDTIAYDTGISSEVSGIPRSKFLHTMMYQPLRTWLVDTLLRQGWVRYGGRGIYQVGNLTRKTAKPIERDLLKNWDVMKNTPSIYVDIGYESDPAEQPVSYKLAPEDIEAASFDIRRAIQQQRRLPEEMRRLSAPTDLLKISQAELDTQTARLRSWAGDLARKYGATFHDTARKIFQQELEDTLLAGFKEILARPGRGPKGTIGRTRMRSAIYDLLWETEKQLGSRISYLALEDETNAAIQNALKAYEDRRLSLTGLRSALQNLLRYSYEQAIIIGKRDAYIKRIEARGEVVPASAYTRPFALTVEDRHRIDEELEDEYQYLTGFIEEAKRRRTEDIPFGPYMRWRGKLYSQALRGLEQYGEISELSPYDTIHWVINPEAESCPDCIRIAAGGPYTKDTLPTVPRRGDTRCLSNCQCRLEVEYAVKAA